VSYYFTIEKDNGKTSIFPMRKTIKECRETYYKVFPDEESRQHFTEVKVYTLVREHGRYGPIRSKLHGYYDKVFSRRKNTLLQDTEEMVNRILFSNPWSK